MPVDRFVVGDVVRVIEHPEGEGNRGPQPGHEGRVVMIRSDEDHPTYGQYLLVEFAGSWNGGHDGEYENPTASGWNIWAKYVESLTPKNFYLVGLIDKQEVILDDQPTFEHGKDAAIHAQKLTAERGYKVQPRRFMDTNNDAWREREKTRLADGTYAPMPQSWDLTPIPDHFLHRAKDDPSMVAYTDSNERGVLDRQTRTTPGRYLEKFYSEMPDLERKRYIAMIDGPDGLFYAVTPQEIEDVYTRGPRSCMAHKVGEGDICSPIHPTQVYGDSDLRLAYLKSDGRITARALIWPEKKVIGRIYGDDARLRRSLESEGFRWGPYLNEARIRKVWDAQQGQYVLPYVDNCQTLWDPDPDDKEGWLIIREEGNVYAGNTRGFGTSLRWCPKSERWALPKGFRFIHGVNEEWDLENCYHEVAEIYRASTDREEYWPRSMLVQVHDYGWMHKDDAETQTFVSCHSGHRYHNNEKVVLGNGEAVSSYEARRLTRLCSGNGKRYFNHHMRAIGGVHYSQEYLDSSPELRLQLETEAQAARERINRQRDETLQDDERRRRIRAEDVSDSAVNMTLAELIRTMPPRHANEFLGMRISPIETTFNNHWVDTEF